jgi:hypothetical protein
MVVLGCRAGQIRLRTGLREDQLRRVDITVVQIAEKIKYEELKILDRYFLMLWI